MNFVKFQDFWVTPLLFCITKCTNISFVTTFLINKKIISTDFSHPH